MTTYQEFYREQKLSAIKSATGWHAVIGDTRIKTGLHPSAALAFAEARRYLDEQTKVKTAPMSKGFQALLGAKPEK